jgi:hypothetical protein
MAIVFPRLDVSQEQTWVLRRVWLGIVLRVRPLDPRSPIMLPAQAGVAASKPICDKEIEHYAFYSLAFAADDGSTNES